MADAMTVNETSFFRDCSAIRAVTDRATAGTDKSAAQHKDAATMERGLLDRAGSVQPGDADSGELSFAGGWKIHRWREADISNVWWSGRRPRTTNGSR